MKKQKIIKKFFAWKFGNAPAAEPEILQAELATGTDGDLPTQKLASIINNAEAQKDAPANSIKNSI